MISVYHTDFDNFFTDIRIFQKFFIFLFSPVFSGVSFSLITVYHSDLDNFFIEKLVFFRKSATAFHRFVAYEALRCISAAYATKGHLTVTVNRHCILLVKMLQQHEEDKQRLGDRWKGDDWVFTQWNGEIMNPQTPTKQF